MNNLLIFYDILSLTASNFSAVELIILKYKSMSISNEDLLFHNKLLI
jgi:hypothetical protein